MRQTCFDCIYELARQDARVVFLGSDMGAGSLQRFKEEMPDRFFMEGVSEANIVGMAVGLALEGFIPYVTTIATFLTRRCFEQVMLDIGLHHAHVRLIGSGGGLVYAPLGPTHQAVDDLALMGLVPGMTIVVPADAAEMRRLMPLTLEYPGPLYIRLAMGGEPVVVYSHMANDPYAIGHATILHEGADGLIVTTGIMTQVAMRAVQQLATRHVHVGLLQMSTVKPLDVASLCRAVHSISRIVVLEEHSVMGGLGSAVLAVLASADLLNGRRFRHLGLSDTFTTHYGTQDSLLACVGLTAERVVGVMEALMCEQ